jgi:small subunit ribosomal protein S13
MFVHKIFKKRALTLNLQKIYGIGKTSSLDLCSKSGILPNYKVEYLRGDQKQRILNFTRSLTIENQLLREVKQSQEFLINLRSTRGLRNKLGYPVRGQRTHTNAQTKKKLKHSVTSKFEKSW